MMYCKSNYIPTFYSIIIQIIFHNKNDTTTAWIINWEFSQQNEKKRLLILHLVSYLYWNIVWLQNQQKIAIFDRVHDSIRHDTIAYIFVLTENFPLKLLFFCFKNWILRTNLSIYISTYVLLKTNLSLLPILDFC